MASGKASDRITCPHCQGSLKAPPLPPGSLCTCPKCGQSFPVGQPAVAATPQTPAPAAAPVTKPQPTALSKPKPEQTPKQKPPLVEAPVRAELAAPQSVKPAPVKPVQQPPAKPIPATPIVAVSEDDVIGQMLLGSPGPASSTSPPAASDVDQDRQLKALLAAPASTTAAPAHSVATAAPVERQSHLATATTQPAHRQEPPSPKPAAPIKKPKAPEIPVVCKLCGTRMYAKPEQVGTRVRCPDCHSENLIDAPQPAAAPARSGPSLEDGGDFALGEVTQRPGYRPMVDPRGDYAAIKYLDTSARPRREHEPPQRDEAPPRPERGQPQRVMTEMTMTMSPAAQRAAEEEEEIPLSEPVERIEVRQIVSLPPPDDPEEDNQFKGRFRDEEWGFVADPNEKDAWKRSPFYYGILGFLFYPQVLYRLIFYSFVLSVDIAMFVGAILFSHGETPLLFAALGLTVSSSILSALMVGGALPCLVAITQDTANGSDAVVNWPDWNIADWLLQALMIPAAAALAGVPGGIAATFLIAMGQAGVFYAPFPILMSELMFFPVVFGSMLAENSFLPLSRPILASMTRKGDGWLLFYVASILLGMLMAGSLALIEVGVQAQTVIVAPFAALLWVTATILYFRLLGRLLWYVQNYRRQRDKPE